MWLGVGRLRIGQTLPVSRKTGHWGLTANCCFMGDMFLGNVTVSDVLVTSFEPEFVNILCEAYYIFHSNGI